MKIRIFKAIPSYGGYIQSFYRIHPELGKLSFNEQIERLRDDCFQWILSWGKYNSDPDVEIIETVPNNSNLQKAWAQENGIVALQNTDIVLEQIKHYKPTICILYSPEVFDTCFIERIRHINPGIIIGGYDGMDRKNTELYNGYDFIITCSEYISAFYSSHGITTFPMKFGFDREILSKTINREKKHLVSFSGSIFPGIHDDRFELLSYLEKRIPVALASDFGYSPNGTIFSRHVLRQLRNLSFKKYPDYFRLFRNNQGPLYGIEMFQFLRDSKLILNLHGDRISFAANIRMYEATGMGSCLLTDWKENLPSIFEPDKEILTYSSREEAIDKIAFCSSHPDYSDSIAKKGQKRTLAEYSYDRLIPETIRCIKQLLQ